MSLLFLSSLAGGCGADQPPPPPVALSDIAPPAPCDELPRCLPKVDAHIHIETADKARVALEVMNLKHTQVAFVVGSVRGTFALPVDEDAPWQGYRALNDTLLTFAAESDRLWPFPIVRGDEQDAASLLRGYVARGARGLKMFGGYAALKVGRLDGAAYDPVFRAAAALGLPIINHASLNYFPDEVEGMLLRHRDVVFILPHLGFKKSDPTVLGEAWLERFDNLYFDLSNGGLQGEGLWLASQNVTRWREFLERYADRVLWGSDNVLSRHTSKSVAFASAFQQCYFDFFERADTFECAQVRDYLRQRGRSDAETVSLPALGLSQQVLRKLYYDNAARLFPELSTAP